MHWKFRTFMKGAVFPERAGCTLQSHRIKNKSFQFSVLKVFTGQCLKGSCFAWSSQSILSILSLTAKFSLTVKEIATSNVKQQIAFSLYFFIVSLFDVIRRGLTSLNVVFILLHGNVSNSEKNRFLYQLI